MFLYHNAFRFYYEDEPLEETPETPETPEETPEEKAAKAALAKKTTFTQDDVNRIVAEERRKVAKANDRTIKELKTLQQSASITEEQRQQLENQIETLRNESLSKEQLAKKENIRIEKERKTEIEKHQKEAEKWKNRYGSSIIKRTLTDAAAKGKAFNPSQVVTLLESNTRLVDELGEDNQPTGELIPKVKFKGKDAAGKAVMLELDPDDVIKQMKEMPLEYGNLFESGVVSGLGGNNVGYQHQSGSAPRDHAEYLKWRKTQKG